MPRPLITDLRVSLGAQEELARHGLTQDDAVEVWLEDPSYFRDKEHGRSLMIGPDYGGRLLTVVIEPTAEDGEWDVVTGWPSSNSQRSAWENERRTTKRR